MYSIRKDRSEILCIAAILNSSSYANIDKETSFRQMIIHELDDYFRHSPSEASQFSKEKTKTFIESLTETEFLRLLHEMGRCPFGEIFDECNRWTTFVERVAAAEPAGND